jgi:hypothetical protein
VLHKRPFHASAACAPCKNGRRQAAVRGTADEIECWPAVNLFMPGGSATWRLTELDTDGDTAFGLRGPKAFPLFPACP